MLTQCELKNILSYDQETGIFRWMIKGKNIAIGRIAGGITNQGYVRITVNKTEYRAARLAWLYMTGSWPEEMVDHKDGNRRNNAFSNLRECTNTLNQQNSAKSKSNTTGIKGVDIKKGLYRVRISVNKMRLELGRFIDLELAELVASEAREKYHGEFARNH